MKKFTLFLLIVFLFVFAANAQKARMNQNNKPYHALPKGVVSHHVESKGPVVEDFEEVFPPFGWSLTPGSGSWAQSSAVDHTTGTGNAAIYNCYFIDAPVPAYLQTPEMAVTNGDATLTFWCNYYYVAGADGSNDKLYVDISTDGGATWTSGTTNYLSSIAKDTWTQFSIDLSTHIGQNVILRFKAISNFGSYNIAIDDVAGPARFVPSHDLAVLSFTPSGYVITGGALIPQVTVANYGGEETAYSVQLSDGASYSETVSVTNAIASGTTANVLFPNWAPTTTGDQHLTATVTVAGDVNALNNVRQQDVYIYNGARIAYGYSIWNDGGFPSYFPLFYDLSNPQNYVMLADQTTDDFAVHSGEWLNGIWYAFDYDETMEDTITRFITINTTTGEKTVVASDLVNVPADMAYDYSTHTMFGITNVNEANYALYSVDITTGVSTQIGSGLEVGDPFTLACTLNGQLYSVFEDGKLYKLDKTTGAKTLVGSTGITDVKYYQSMAFDHRNNDVLYWNQQGEYTYGDLYTIDTLTGVATSMGQLPGKSEITGFAIPYSEGQISSQNDILSFRFNGLTPAVIGTINENAHTVALTVPMETNVTALVPTIVVSGFAAVSPANGVVQDFTSPVHYTVTAQDGTPQIWIVSVNISSGLNEASENIVRIYPNPANDMVNVKMNSTISKISIININGKVIAESVLNNNEGSINTSTIANGLYFLRAETSNGSIVRKIQILR